MEMNYEAMIQEEEKKGSVARGLIGAVIAAIVAAVLWAVIGVATDSVFVIAGLGVGLLVCWGYDLLKGREGAVRSVIVTVCVILAVVAGDLGYWAWTINSTYNEEMDVFKNGTDAEVAAYIFEGDPEGLAEFNAMPAITQKLGIQNVRNQMEGYTLEMYANEIIHDGGAKEAFIKDCGTSIFFGLLGSFGLILNGKKKKAAKNAVNFDEARVGGDNAVAAEEFTPLDTADSKPADEQS